MASTYGSESGVPGFVSRAKHVTDVKFSVTGWNIEVGVVLPLFAYSVPAPELSPVILDCRPKGV